MSNPDIEVDVLPVGEEHIKCPRCWTYHRLKYNFDGLCDKCQQVILSDYPEHESVVGIKEAIKFQKNLWNIL